MMFHVVDDTKTVREITEAYLESLGHSVVSFECPQAYIDFVNSPDYKKPIAVFTDISMPIMNGYEMINIVSRIVPKLKFVVMTAEPSIQSEHMNKSCMYISKPFKLEMFANVVMHLIACHISSPSDKLGCSNIDDRAEFSLSSWTCPTVCTDCSSNELKALSDFD